MTRINVLPPELLSDEHLRGEYHEMTRPISKVEKAIAKGKSPSDYKISPVWKLGKGHETFYFDKMSYLRDRYVSVARVMSSRGFSINMEAYENNLSRIDSLPDEWKGNYEPTPEDMYWNMARVVKQCHFKEALIEFLD